MDKINNIELLPITLQEVTALTKEKKIVIPTQIKIKLYQTSVRVTDNFYRPISKILDIHE